MLLLSSLQGNGINLPLLYSEELVTSSGSDTLPLSNRAEENTCELRAVVDARSDAGVFLPAFAVLKEQDGNKDDKNDEEHEGNDEISNVPG